MKSLDKYNNAVERYNEIIEIFPYASPRKQKKLQKEFTKLQNKLPQLLIRIESDKKFRREASAILTVAAITSWLI